MLAYSRHYGVTDEVIFLLQLPFPQLKSSLHSFQLYTGAFELPRQIVDLYLVVVPSHTVLRAQVDLLVLLFVSVAVYASPALVQLSLQRFYLFLVHCPLGLQLIQLLVPRGVESSAISQFACLPRRYLSS